MVKDEEQWSQNDQEDHWTKAVMSHRELLRGIRGLKMSIPKLCTVCRMSSSVMYCKAHDAQLCRGCDSKIHGGGASCHEREWLCDVCEQAPAVVTCKADAASLCVACDNDIHSANPLAGRHERIPLSPFHGFPQEPNNNLECSSFLNDDGGGDTELDDAGNGTPHTLSHSDGADEHRYPEESAVPWLISEPPSKQNLISADDDRSTVKDKLKFKAYLQSIDFFQDVESYVDLEYLNTTTASSAPILTSSAASVCMSMGADSMVPVHTPEVYDHSSKASNDSAGSLDLDAYKSNYAFRAASLIHCVSSSSMDVGVVPESATTNDLTSPFSDPKAFQIHQNNISQMGEQPELMGREAKVIRYREKRKNRKFEKTIRYASRKAYAETRPRIKGRFAKRTDAEVEQLYSSSLVSDQGYDVVSSF